MFIVDENIGSTGSVGAIAQVIDSPVHQQRIVLVRLGIVHRRPGRAIDHDGWPVTPQRPADRGLVGHVELAAGQAGDVRTPLAQDGDEIPAEHPPGARDEPLTHATGTGPGRRSGCHQPRFSRYHRTVALSPSRKGVRGA